MKTIQRTKERKTEMKRQLGVIAFSVAAVVSVCLMGCNSMNVNVDPAKQAAQAEANRINSEVEAFLKSNNYIAATTFLLDHTPSGSSVMDREIGRVRRILLEKVWDAKWGKLKSALEAKYSEFRNADSAVKVRNGVVYFSKVADNPFAPVKLSYWLSVADKDFPQNIEVKRNKLNIAFNALRDNYKKKLEDLAVKLEDRDFRAACDKLLNEVREALQKQEFAHARGLLWGRNTNIAERLQPAMLAFRIGVLNTFVNPLHLVYIVDDINNTVDGLIKAKKFDEALKFLDAYAVEGTENKLLVELLEVVKKEYGETYLVGEKELSAFFRIHADELQMLLDARVGTWKHPADGSLEKALEALAKGMKDEVLDEGAIQSYISNIRKSIVARNVTTAALKDRLANLKVESFALYSDKLEENVAKIKAQKRALVKLQSVDQIDFAGKIYAAERAAIKEVSTAKGLLLAEYARLMRMLEADANSLAGVNKQFILSAAVVLDDFPIVKFAIESGADATCASPYVEDSPFVLAIKGGHRKMLAYLIENKAASNLERDGMVAMKQAILMNRADLVDLVYEVGFAPSSAQNEELMNFVCANGRDQVFFKFLMEKGMMPKHEDYVLAAKAGNVPIVRWFVEKKFYSVNDEKVRSVAVGPAKDYLIERGMQKGAVSNLNSMPHKAAK